MDAAIAEGWPRERIIYLPNLFLIGRHSGRGKSIASGGRAPLALALGRLHPNKGFDLLLEAHRNPGGHSLDRRDRPLRPRRTPAARLGIIGRSRFLGWRDDVPRLLASASMPPSLGRRGGSGGRPYQARQRHEDPRHLH